MSYAAKVEVIRLKEQIDDLSRELAAERRELEEERRHVERLVQYRLAVCRELDAARREKEELVAGVEAYAKDCVKRKETELRERTIEECRHAALLYPFTGRAMAHSNQAVVTNVAGNIADEIRALSVQPDPHKDESKPDDADGWMKVDEDDRLLFSDLNDGDEFHGTMCTGALGVCYPIILSVRRRPAAEQGGSGERD